MSKNLTIVIGAMLILTGCGTSKETAVAPKDYETVAAEKGCDCVNNAGKPLIEVGDSCLANGMVEASKEIHGDENVMPYSGLTDMQEGIKLIQSKMIASCNN